MRGILRRRRLILGLLGPFFFAYGFRAVVGQPASFFGIFRVFLFSILIVLHLGLQYIVIGTLYL